MDYDDDLIQKLKKTTAGCKLLSRLEHMNAPGDTSKDPSVNFNVPNVADKIEKIEKDAKRPPSALMVSSEGKFSMVKK